MSATGKGSADTVVSPQTGGRVGGGDNYSRRSSHYHSIDTTARHSSAMQGGATEEAVWHA